MSTAAPEGSSKSVAVTIVGLLTLLFGLAYAGLGGSLVFAGADLAKRMEGGNAAGGFGWLLKLMAEVGVVIGIAFLVSGVLGILAGLGTLSRQQWGRILTFITAALAMLLGLLSLSAYDEGAVEAVLGAVQLLYGILAFVILIKNGAEFS